MLSDIMPAKMAEVLQSIDQNRLYEVRIRQNLPIMIGFAGGYYFLSEKGISQNEKEAMIGTKEWIETVLLKASNYSVYAVNEQIKQGFITVLGGIRIGIAGEVVQENGHIITVKDISSLNIRIAHEVKNCSLSALKYILNGSGFHNTLVLSPPGAGKTTFLRDIAWQISHLNLAYNILILDERFEIAGFAGGTATLNVGKFTDVISGSSKQYGFEQGIRAMRPDIIFTDEIANKDDVEAILFAARCGVKIAASCHAVDLTEFKKKPNFEKLIENKIFERYVVLSSAQGPGTYEAIFDKDFKCLYCR